MKKLLILLFALAICGLNSSLDFKTVKTPFDINYCGATISSGSWTIGSGGNYSTQAAFSGALATALSAECSGQIISNFADSPVSYPVITFSTCVLHIYTSASCRLTGATISFDTTKYYIYQTAGGSCMTLNPSQPLFFSCEGVQMWSHLTTNQFPYVFSLTYSDAGNNIWLSNCVLRFDKDGSTHSYSGNILSANAYGVWHISNCLIYGMKILGSSNGCSLGYASAGSTMYHCVISSCDVGVVGDSNITATDCICQGCGTNWSGSYNAASSYNSCDAGTPPGTNGTTGSVLFVNTTAGSEDFHLQSGDTIAKSSGTAISGQTSDIVGTSWAGTPSKGAYEYVSGGVTVTPTFTGQIFRLGW